MYFAKEIFVQADFIEGNGCEAWKTSKEQTLHIFFVLRSYAVQAMLVKKGQNNKIINLHDKTVIHTSRFVYIH